jgi:hypothetical protein
MNKPKPAKSTSTTTQTLPDWVEQAGKENYDIVKGITGQPYTGYAGPTVADQSNMTTQAYDYLMSNIGASDPLYQQAAGLLGESYGNANTMFGTAADTLARAGEDIPSNMGKWFNPWTAEVESNAMRNLRESLTQSQMAGADKASSANAFGGTRFGVQAGVTAAEGAKKAGDLSAELRSKGWDTAIANALSNRTSLTGVGQAQSGVGRDISAAGTGAAAGLESVGKTRQGSMLADVGAMGAAGQSEEAYNQKQIDADIKKWQAAQDYPLEQVNARMAALGLTPYPKTETTKKEGTSEQKGTDWASTILGAAKLFLSDKRMKTDVQKVGKEDGLDMYAFRYKGDPKSYPKVVGPLAQDVEKKHPRRVKKIGKYKGILARAR